MTWSAVRRLCHHFLPVATSNSEIHTLTTHYRHILRHPQTYSAIFACRKQQCSSFTKGIDEQSEKNEPLDKPVNDIDSNSIHTQDLTGDAEREVEFEDTAVWNANIQHFQTDTRKVGRTFDDQKEIYMLKPDSPPDAKILRVAVIGQPNCGKSTLTNSLMGWRVCSVSSKVHTTRKNTMAVYTEDNTQIVFVDTPGALRPGTRKKLDLERSMELDPVRSFASADLVIAMVNVYWNNNRHTIDPQTLQLLYMYRHIPAVLVLNKIDLLKNKSEILYTVQMLTDAVIGGKSLDQYKSKTKKKMTKKEQLFANTDRKMGLKVQEFEEEEDAVIPQELLEPVDEAVKQGELDWDTYFNMLRKADKMTRNRRGWPLFEQVFSVSALRQNGIVDLKEYLMSKTYPAPWPYHSSLVTDQGPEEVVILSVRQALLDSLMNEVPYQLGLDLIMMEGDPEGDLLNIVVNITCATERQLTIFLGRDGEGIRKVSGIAKQAIRDTFRCEVRLKLVANLKKGKRKATNL